MAFKPVPVQFRKSPPSITTFSFEDIASGKGIINFNAANATNLADHFLTTQTPFSERVLTDVLFSSPTLISQIDLDFDVEFNRSRKMKGQLIANIPFGCGYKEVSNNFVAHAIVRVRKCDGSTETELANAKGKTLTITGTTIGQVMDCILIDVPLTHFKKGEKLRITVNIFASNSTGDASVMLGHDPQNRAFGFWDQESGGAAKDYTFGTNPTNLNFEVPFELEV